MKKELNSYKKNVDKDNALALIAVEILSLHGKTKYHFKD